MNYGEKEMDHGHARLRSLYTDFQYNKKQQPSSKNPISPSNIADAKPSWIKV